MGHRMEIYCSETDAKFMIETAAKYGVEAKIVGRAEKSVDEFNHVTIKANGKVFEY